MTRLEQYFDTCLVERYFPKISVNVLVCCAMPEYGGVDTHSVPLLSRYQSVFLNTFPDIFSEYLIYDHYILFIYIIF